QTTHHRVPPDNRPPLKTRSAHWRNATRGATTEAKGRIRRKAMSQALQRSAGAAKAAAPAAAHCPSCSERSPETPTPPFSSASWNVFAGARKHAFGAALERRNGGASSALWPRSPIASTQCPGALLALRAAVRGYREHTRGGILREVVEESRWQ